MAPEVAAALIANRPHTLQRIAEVVDHPDANVPLKAAIYVVDRAPSEEKLPESYQEALRQLRERLETGTLRLIDLGDTRLPPNVRALPLAENGG